MDTLSLVSHLSDIEVRASAIETSVKARMAEKPRKVGWSEYTEALRDLSWALLALSLTSHATSAWACGVEQRQRAMEARIADLEATRGSPGGASPGEPTKAPGTRSETILRWLRRRPRSR